MRTEIKEYLFFKSTEFYEEPFIASASNKEEAIYKIAQNKIRTDEVFVEHMEDKSINMGFASEMFYQIGAEIQLFSDVDGSQLVNDSELIREFTKRVNHFFGLKKELAIEFIDYYLSEKDLSSLSDELLIDIWMRGWNDYRIIEVNMLKRY